jgi:Tfp pilus assembly protein PilN
MRAVNLIPSDARRDRGPVAAGQSLGPMHVLVAVAAIAVVLVLLRVLADNTASSRQATLGALRTQVALVQAQEARLTAFTAFIRSGEQRVSEIRTLADARFPWQRSLTQLSHLLPRSTSLKSLTASTSTGSASTGGAAAPTFNLIGCANTPNQDGVATVMRRLRALTGAAAVTFTSSTRTSGCGDSFNISVVFGALPGTAGVSTATGASSGLPPAGGTTPASSSQVGAGTTTSGSGAAVPPAATVQPAAATTRAPAPTPGSSTNAGSGAGA